MFNDVSKDIKHLNDVINILSQTIDIVADGSLKNKEMINKLIDKSNELEGRIAQLEVNIQGIIELLGSHNNYFNTIFDKLNNDNK